MSKKAHAKRRNVALMNEWLVRKIAKCLVEGDQKGAGVALRIVKRHFKPGTELHREFKLMNALLKTTVANAGTAVSIVEQAKQAAKSYDVNKLDREKSLLIRNVNHQLSDDTIYEATVPDYRIIATVQTLLNEWRRPAASQDLAKVAQYEDRLVTHLVTEKVTEGPEETLAEQLVDPRLLMKVMMKRLNERYAGNLSAEQRGLVQAYAYSTATGDAGNTVRLKLAEVRDRLVTEVDTYVNENPTETYVNEQLGAVRCKLLAEGVDGVVTSETVSRYMQYVRLLDELVSVESTEMPQGGTSGSLRLKTPENESVDSKGDVR